MLRYVRLSVLFLPPLQSLFIGEFIEHVMEATSSYILYLPNLIKIHPAVLELQQMCNHTPPALYALILCTQST